MRQLILFLMATALGLGTAVAQKNFSLSHDTLKGSFPIDKEDHKLKAMANTELSSLTLQWRILKMEMPKNWENSLCDNFQCYFNISVGYTKIGSPIDAGTTMPLEAGVNTIGASGSALLTVKVFEKDDTTKADTVTFIWDFPVGIAEKAPTHSFNLYPNPAKSNFNITFDKPLKDNLSLKVYNLVGQEQRNVLVNQIGRTVSVDIRNLQPGTYLVQFITPDGKMTTQRFNKK